MVLVFGIVIGLGCWIDVIVLIVELDDRKECVL